MALEAPDSQHPSPHPRITQPATTLASTSGSPDTVAYVAGPMAGQPGHGYPPFEAAAAQLRSEGLVVLAPHENLPAHIHAASLRMSAEDFKRSRYYKWLMHRDFGMVLRADLLFMLPGWQNSGGATKEALVATTVGTPLWSYDPDPDKRRVLRPSFNLSIVDFIRVA